MLLKPPLLPVLVWPDSLFRASAVYRRSLCRIWQIDTRGRWRRTLSYVLRCACRPVATLAWLQGLELRFSAASLQQFARQELKPHRAYINRHYNFSERTQAFFGHHDLLEQMLLDGSCRQTLNQGSLHLANIVAKHDAPFDLKLSRTRRFDREGELILSLEGPCGVLQSLVFSLGYRQAQPCFEIGCLQGPADASAREQIRQATRSLHGIRPKNLLLDTLYQLARSWGIVRIFAVSNEARVFRSAAVYADYDYFWLELGGQPDGQGFFVLPATLSHQDPETVASQRRAEYRRRKELRDGLAQALASRLDGLMAARSAVDASLNERGRWSPAEDGSPTPCLFHANPGAR